MRIGTRMAQLAVSAAALTAAGCAAGGASGSSQVSLAISAPTTGATVGVHQVMVTGTVTPATAHVVVNGQPAKVSGGEFKRSLWVGAQNQPITVVGDAPGYTSGKATSEVSYSPGVAAQLVAAATPTLKTAPSGISSSRRISASLGPTGTAAIDAAFSLSSPSHSHSPSSTGSSGAHPTSSSSPTSGPPSSGSGNASSGGSTSPTSGGSAPSSSPPSPPPPPTPAQIAAAIKRYWVHHCITRQKQGSVVAYCTCTYRHLEKAGALSTKQRYEHLIKQLQPYERTGDETKLPKFVQAAVAACVNVYPPADPLTGGKVSQLPGVNQPGQPGNTAPTEPTDGNPAGQPTSTEPVTPVPVSAP